MTPEELQAIQTRCDAATPGEWGFTTENWVDGGVHLRQRTLSGSHLHYNYPLGTVEGDFAEADAAFIAHARSDVPALLAEVTRLRGLVEAAYDEGFNDGRADERGRNWKSGMFVDSNAKRQLEGL